MTSAPLPASIMAPALVRQVNGNGGFATVLVRGSPWGAAMLVVHRHGPMVRILERMPSLSGTPVWHVAAKGDEPIATFIERQRRFDPDLWVIELDIADPERFIPAFPPVD